MRRAQQEVPLDQALSNFTISEDPAEHARVLQKTFDAGVTTLLVHSAQPDQPAIVRFFGEHVLSQVQRRAQPVL